MKYFFAIMAAVGLLGVSNAGAFDGEKKQPETLFGSGSAVKSSFSGGFDIVGTTQNSDPALGIGGRLTWVINNTFGIGLKGIGITSNHNVHGYRDVFSGKQAYLRSGYGGLFLEYVNNPSSLLHFSGNILIGAGGSSYTDNDFNNIDNKGNCDDRRNFESTAFFVCEPGIGAELNVTTWMKFGINAGYRFVSGADLPNTTNKDLSGPVAGIKFTFGNFEF